MKVSKIILGMGVCLALVSCSDLLGNKDLEAQLNTEKSNQNHTVGLYCGPVILDGSTKPVYVVDGKIWSMDKAFSDTLDPADIKAIEVLRDEKAKKYGPIGEKNGVIIITTKKKARN